MPETMLTENDYNVLYTEILNYVKLLSSNVTVEGIYCITSIHNYHNIYSKPVVDITIISSMPNGELSDLVDNLNNSYNEMAVVRTNIINHKSLLDVMNMKRLEIIDSTILYDRYGEYRRMQTELKKTRITETKNPRVIRLNHKISSK